MGIVPGIVLLPVFAGVVFNSLLSEVFMDEAQYGRLVELLKRKKNIILQGAPGVGKTFAARRLAWSMTGERNPERVQMVQFHQSYSYEDFIAGFRPTEEGGFRVTDGPFYTFCKRAEEDDGKDYFFIIDEINRGNLSKIFGELMMLLESDKRGEYHKLRLLYKNEKFSVPPNVYLVGTMNTADRSLALIDYALRRRFAFVELEPGFETSQFKARQNAINESRFSELVNTVKQLNESICGDASLGAGFRIGHSYFCTDDKINGDWLHSVIEYELIPLLSEYWFDEPDKVNYWAAQLRSVL